MATEAPITDSAMGDSQDWPPGTILLEHVEASVATSRIILEPRPSDDPNDPLNWPQMYKYFNFSLVALYTFLIFAFTCMYTPLWGGMSNDLGISVDRLNITYATNNVFMGVGAFFMIPFVLKYGRRPIYLFSMIAQFALAVWYARLQTYGELMAINIISCSIGAVSEVIVQLTVADLFFVHERGLINTIYACLFSSGGTLMPTIAGQIATHVSWRWVWWMMAIIFGICIPIYAFFYEETKYSYAPTGDVTSLQESVNSNQTKETPTKNDVVQDDEATKMEFNNHPRTEAEATAPSDKRNASFHDHEIHINPEIPRKTFSQRLILTQTTGGTWKAFTRHLWQPLYILFTFPGVFYMAVLWGTTMAWMTTMLSTLSARLPLPPYNFTPGDVGLMSIAAFIGYNLGGCGCGYFADRLIKRLAFKNNGIYEPEMRLWVMVPYIPLLPGGTIMYAVGLSNEAHWAILAGGALILNIGVAPMNSLSLTYLTDCYPDIIGDALVALTLPRYIISAAMIYAVNPWVASMGYTWTFVSMSILGTVILLGILVFIRYGKHFRVKTRERYRRLAAHQYQSRLKEQ